jgi:hypothetical protein
MPLVYGISLATRGITTGGGASTEFDVCQIRPVARNVGLQQFLVGGMANAVTSLSGNSFCVITLTTPGAAGTALTPQPKDPGNQAAQSTASSAPTLGATGRINHIVFNCGVSGPGGWVAPNPDSCIWRQGSSGHSIDIVQFSATASLTFTWSGELVE